MRTFERKLLLEQLEDRNAPTQVSVTVTVVLESGSTTQVTGVLDDGNLTSSRLDSFEAAEQGLTHACQLLTSEGNNAVLGNYQTDEDTFWQGYAGDNDGVFGSGRSDTSTGTSEMAAYENSLTDLTTDGYCSFMDGAKMANLNQQFGRSWTALETNNPTTALTYAEALTDAKNQLGVIKTTIARFNQINNSLQSISNRTDRAIASMWYAEELDTLTHNYRAANARLASIRSVSNIFNGKAAVAEAEQWMANNP